MDNTHKQPTRIMDFAPVKRRPAPSTARVATSRQPAHSSISSASAHPQTAVNSPRPACSRPQAVRPRAQVNRPRPHSIQSAHSTQPARPAATFSRPGVNATDPLSARPLSRPAGFSSMPSRQRAAAPRIVQSTTVKSVAATSDRIESFEFGVIEDLSPVVKPEPPMIPDSRAALTSRSASSAQSTSIMGAAAEDNYLDMRGTASTPAAGESSKHHSSEKSPLFSRKSKSASPASRKSPFLSSVNVPKRPLSASAPTGIHAPVAAQAPAASAEHPHRKKRKNAPFIVIVILSVLLGVSLGAIVYFVLPH